MMNTVPMFEFEGLYDSCRQVQKEMDYECTAKMDRMIANALTPTDLSLAVQFPSSFDTARRVEVVLDAGVFAAIEPPAASDAIPFLQLARLPLETLNIRFINRHDMSSTTQKNILKLICDCCIGLAKSSGKNPTPVLVSRIVFEDPAIELSAHTIIRVGRPRDFKGKAWYIVIEYETVGGVELFKTVTLARKKHTKRLKRGLEKNKSRREE